MENEKRLIDANDAVKLLRGKCVAKYPSTFIMGLLASSTEIGQMPTVDAVEVVHGHWIWNDEDEYWACSNCELSALNNYRGNSTDSNYCPNCGAKMDGDTQCQ